MSSPSNIPAIHCPGCSYSLVQDCLPWPALCKSLTHWFQQLRFQKQAMDLTEFPVKRWYCSSCQR